MEIDEHITALRREATRFADAARRAELDADITYCPGWSMRDLVRHLSEIHLWAAANFVKRRGAARVWAPDEHTDLVEYWPDLAVFWPDDDDLIDWYLQTNANLVHALESAPPDVAAPTFLPAPSALAMWARRQAHETSIHRYDAAYATGDTTGFDPAFAADGVSELLYAFYGDGSRPQGRTSGLDRDHTIHVHAHDTGDDWYTSIGHRSITRGRADAPADLTVTGTASDLYLALWNRGDDAGITATGDLALLETWHTFTGPRWSLEY